MHDVEYDGLTKKERALAMWKRVYCWVIPTITSFIYVLSYFLTKQDILDWNTLFYSENISHVLTAIITFISIVISLFGVLLPIMISTKDTNEIINWVFSVIARKYFINCIKKLFLSGLVTIFVSCILFFNDVFFEFFNFIITLGLLWSLLYFMSSSYRFIGILLALLIENKDTAQIKVKK